MPEHFTAWVTDDSDILTGNYCTVDVLRDEIVSVRYSDGDDTEIPDWGSDGSGPVFSADLSVRHDEEDPDVYLSVVDEAEKKLRDAGWRTVGDWEPITTGNVSTVERID